MKRSSDSREEARNLDNYQIKPKVQVYGINTESWEQQADCN